MSMAAKGGMKGLKPTARVVRQRKTNPQEQQQQTPQPQVEAAPKPRQ